jgi:NADH-quinone oxidoreductase subunit K
MNVPLTDALVVAVGLFCVGLAGALLRRSAITIFLSIELMLNAANLAIVGFGSAVGGYTGQILVFFAIVVAAAEAAVGLAIFVAVFRHGETIDVNRLNLLKW